MEMQVPSVNPPRDKGDQLNQLVVSIKDAWSSKRRLNGLDQIPGDLRPAVKWITHELFKTEILPAIQRALLRQPELVLDSIAVLISQIELDLSSYSPQLVKLISPQLRSNEPSLRQLAVVVCRHLARQCSDPSAIEDAVNQLFNILSGKSPEGKLTNVDCRLAVISSIEELAGHSASTGAQSLSELTTELVTKLLDQEMSEQIIHATIVMMRPWCARFIRPPPSTLINWIAKYLNSSQANKMPLVRAELLVCLLAAAGRESTISCTTPMLDQLIQETTKAMTAPTGQVGLMRSGACSASLILDLVASDKSLETKCKPILTHLLDPQRIPSFMSEKLIRDTPPSTCSLPGVGTLQCILELISRLALHQGHKLGPPMIKHLTRLVVMLRSHSGSWSLRRSASTVYRKLILTLHSGSNPESNVPLIALQAFIDLYASLEPTLPEETRENETNGPPPGGPEKIIEKELVTPKTVCECLRMIVMEMTSPTGDRQTGIEFTSSLIIACHLPAVFHASPRLWFTLSRAIYKPQTVEQFFNSHPDRVDFINTILDKVQTPSDQRIALNAIHSLSATVPSVFVSPIISRALSALQDEAVSKVTIEEFGIMCTPAGQLYDSSLIKLYREVDTSSKYLKREGKLYSRKSQLEEMEFRRELEKKQKKKAKNEPKPEEKLTKKQIEVMNAQLDREAAVRSRVTPIHARAQFALDAILASAAGNPHQVALELYRILPTLWRLVSTAPLISSPLVNAIVDLRTCAFAGHPRESNVLIERAAYGTVRLLSRDAKIDPRWANVPLELLARKLLKNLHDRTCGNSSSSSSSSPAVSSQLSAPAFAYCFRILKSFIKLDPLVTKGQGVDLSRECRSRALAIMRHVSQLRNPTETANSTSSKNVSRIQPQFSPDFLPRARMIETLVWCIVSCSTLQVPPASSSSAGGGTDNDPAPTFQPNVDDFEAMTEAEQVLLDLVHAASGKAGSASANHEEIDLLCDALTRDSDQARFAALRSLFIFAEDRLPALMVEDVDCAQRLTLRLYTIQFDSFDELASEAKQLFTQLGLDPLACQRSEFETENLLIADLKVNNAKGWKRDKLRGSIARAIEHWVKTRAESPLPDSGARTSHLIDQLIALYDEHNEPLPPTCDEFGRPLPGDPPRDRHEARQGVALVLRAIAEMIPSKDIARVTQFLVQHGLGDRFERVRDLMLEAGVAVVDGAAGRDHHEELLTVLKDHLDSAANDSQADVTKKSVVILMGTLARHLPPGHESIRPILARLIETLNTPSRLVQEAVANCLTPLVPAIPDEADTVLAQLTDFLFIAETYGERKGAAYGIAGIVRGLGTASMARIQLNERLISGLTEGGKEGKKARESADVVSRREAALLAYEQLFLFMGKLFEPYALKVCPHLLLLLGDNQNRVRKAAEDATKALMRILSSHAVSQLLPALLAGMAEDSWRTRVGAIDMLGSMAHCNPKQLSGFLPNIVPKLIDVLSDSAPQVSRASARALRQIGSVIRNPEIASLVPVLLEALGNPDRTNKCLNAMLKTRFVHHIGAPSLALIIPVIQRALESRSPDTRKMAAQIIGNMHSLTDQKDLAPYLPSVLPGLQQSLRDPVPEVRAVTARALGAMVRGVGEPLFKQLSPWIMETLVTETSAVDRSGAAQGYAEMLGALGPSRLDEYMPSIIKMASRQDLPAAVRDGHVMLFVHLPEVFGPDFRQYIDRIITPVLKALADENEFLRDSALQAGQRIVNGYADSAVELLLPNLESGLLDENWRIRHCSVQLLGDLLFRISGVTGKMTSHTADEDDNFATESQQQAIVSLIGRERHDRVLAGLYMSRSDVVLQVRQVALHVWKIIVANTARTLREILPALLTLVFQCLAGHNADAQEVAARTLGDLVKKLGDRLLPEIIPILEGGMKSDSPSQRVGVCIGLTEIMKDCSRDTISAYVDSLVPTVNRALCDPAPEVRLHAASAFDKLHSSVGVRALDEILPHLLDQLASPDPELSEASLDGLRHVMALKSRVVLPYLVPQLTEPPVNTRALSFLSAVAGDAIIKHLPKILAAIVHSLADTPPGSGQEKLELEYASNVLLSVTDETGIRTLVDELLESVKQEDTRRAAVSLLHLYCAHSKVAVRAHAPQLLRALLLLLNDKDEKVLTAAMDGLGSLTKHLDARELIPLTGDARAALRHASQKMRSQHQADEKSGKLKLSKTGKEDEPKLAAHLLRGLCGPRGVAPVLPLYRETILQGSADEREGAAHGLSELIRLASPESLQSSVVAISGPLIRILGDRHPHSVKVAVMDTLSLLLDKVGAHMRAFIPQMQQTFLKALADPHRAVRLHAATALSRLIVVHTRPDPVFQEVHNSVKSLISSPSSSSSTDEGGLRETQLHALRLLFLLGGGRMSPAIRKAILVTLTPIVAGGVGGLLSDDNSRLVGAAAVGSLCRWLADEELVPLVNNHLLADSHSDWTVRHARAVALQIALKECPERFLAISPSSSSPSATNGTNGVPSASSHPDWNGRVVKSLTNSMTFDRIPVIISGLKGTSYLLLHLLTSSSSSSDLSAFPPAQLITTFARCLNHANNDVKVITASGASFLAKSSSNRLPIGTLIKPLVPLLVNGTKEKNSAVRSNCEQALVTVLGMRDGEQDENSLVTDVLAALDVGARNSLADCVQKTLRRAASLNEPVEEEFDETLLTN